MSERLPPSGTQVAAKRLGWDEELTPAQQLDRDPFDHDDVELSGPLLVHDVPADDEFGIPAFRVVLVGGQEADPATVSEKGE